jgi:hypothetical protein
MRSRKGAFQEGNSNISGQPDARPRQVAFAKQDDVGLLHVVIITGLEQISLSHDQSVVQLFEDALPFQSIDTSPDRLDWRAQEAADAATHPGLSAACRAEPRRAAKRTPRSFRCSPFTEFVREKADARLRHAHGCTIRKRTGEGKDSLPPAEPTDKIKRSGGVGSSVSQDGYCSSGAC